MIPTVRQFHSKIARGLLPVRLPSIDACAQAGRGACCSGCDRPITAPDAQYDTLELKRDGTPYRFHAECYAAWKSVVKLLIDKANRP